MRRPGPRPFPQRLEPSREADAYPFLLPEPGSPAELQPATGGKQITVPSSSWTLESHGSHNATRHHAEGNGGKLWRLLL